MQIYGWLDIWLVGWFLRHGNFDGLFCAKAR